MNKALSCLYVDYSVPGKPALVHFLFSGEILKQRNAESATEAQCTADSSAVAPEMALLRAVADENPLRSKREGICPSELHFQ